MSDTGWLASHLGAESERWITHSGDPAPVDPLRSIRIEDIHVNEDGYWVIEFSGDIRDAQALAEGLMRDGWRYEEGKWIEP